MLLLSDKIIDPRAYPDRPYVGVGVVVFRGNHVLLAKRGKQPRRFTWSIPGGAQEINETIRDAAIREVREETGLEINILGLVDVVDSINRDDDGRTQFHYTLVDFFAEWESGKPVAGDDVVDVKWVPLEMLESYDLRQLTLDVIRLAAERRRAFGSS